MKTRIKIVKREGRSYYHPQFRRFFIWWDLREWWGACLSLQSAQEELDRFLMERSVSYFEYPSSNTPKFQLTSTETEHSRFVESGGVTVAKFNCSYAKARELQRDRLFEWDGVLYAFNSWCDNNTLTAIKVNKVS